MGEVQINVEEFAILPQECHQNSMRSLDDQTSMYTCYSDDADTTGTLEEYGSCRQWIEYNSRSTSTTKSSEDQYYSSMEEDHGNETQAPAPPHLRHVSNVDDWLPITASRNGNSWTSTFHLLCSGIGIQTLSLPIAFVSLGWTWGILCLVIAFVWQLYTIGLLVNLHEATPGTRYSRYLHLGIASFGVKLGKLLCIFPVAYLSGATCVMFIITGGGTMKHFYQLMCGDNCTSEPLTMVEWYLVFVCLSISVTLFFSNLNSLAGVSLIGAIASIGFCTILWAVSVHKGMPMGTIHDPAQSASSDVGRVRGVLNALGFIAFVFRGHNLILEIQGTTPSKPKSPSSKPMWRGVAISYLLISACFFPVAICGYWAYGNMITENGGGILKAFVATHARDTPKSVLGSIYVLIIITCVAGYQIYGMVLFDNFERLYVAKKNTRCPKHVRLGIRIFTGGYTFFLSVCFPFLPSLAPLFGGMSLPLTFAYPCFMWIAIKKPRVMSTTWCINVAIGCFGIGLSVLLTTAALWNLICRGLDANFFNPH